MVLPWALSQTEVVVPFYLLEILLWPVHLDNLCRNDAKGLEMMKNGHEESHQTAIVYSVVLIAALCLGVMLYILQSIIIPFLFALCAMYVLQVCMWRRRPLEVMFGGMGGE